MFHGEGAFQAVHPIVHGFDSEAFAAQAFNEQSAQLNIIIDDENSIHSLQGSSFLVDARSFLDCRRSIYKSLLCLANLHRNLSNLYRMRSMAMVES